LLLIFPDHILVGLLQILAHSKQVVFWFVSHFPFTASLFLLCLFLKFIFGSFLFQILRFNLNWLADVSIHHRIEKSTSLNFFRNWFLFPLYCFYFLYIVIFTPCSIFEFMLCPLTNPFFESDILSRTIFGKLFFRYYFFQFIRRMISANGININRLFRRILFIYFFAKVPLLSFFELHISNILLIIRIFIIFVFWLFRSNSFDHIGLS